MDDTEWMKLAIQLAQKAQSQNEVPVGAVLVRNNEVIGEGFNQSIQLNDPTAHAEILAIRHACKKLNNYRLSDSTLYISLEPCPMCVGAIIHSRINKIVFAASDPKTGAAGGAFNLLQSDKHNHVVDVQSGMLADESSILLKNFFRTKRFYQRELKDIKKKEAIAEYFSEKGLPVQLARVITESDRVVNAKYSWIEGEVFALEDVCEAKAQIVGGLLAQIHAQNFQMNGVAVERPKVINWDAIPQFEKLRDVYSKAVSAFDQLNQKTLLSHRDLNQPNIVWSSSGPVIIDWERAGAINPAIELHGVALNWAGVNTGRVVDAAYNAVLEGYSKILPIPVIDDSVRIAGLCSWVEWLSDHPDDQQAIIGLSHLITRYQALLAT